jgi:indole-3-glycerol phosphate synthase
MAINDNTYNITENIQKRKKTTQHNLSHIIKTNTHPTLITEIKFASPSQGTIRNESSSNISNITSIADAMIRGGASAISILTQPYLFNGSPQYFMQVRKNTDIPLLMKDIIIDTIQIDAAQKIDADYILMIQSLAKHGYITDINEYIKYAHKKDLKVLLEVHTRKELYDALETDADIIGINNRNLDTLEIDLNTTHKILQEYNDKIDMPIISESGIETPQDIRYLKECGADAFLIGSSIMRKDNIEAHVKELVSSY